MCKVVNMNTGVTYYYVDCTPLQALQNTQYYIGLSNACHATINKTESGEHLYFDFNGETYAVRNRTVADV